MEEKSTAAKAQTGVFYDVFGLDLYKDADVVPYLEGEKGIGKTTMIEDYAKSREMDCIIIGVASMDHIEFYGRTIAGQEVVTSEKGQTYGSFNKTLPSWVMRVLKNHEKGIPTLLFLDELNRAEPQNLNSLMNLILKREFGADSFKLPDSMFIVAAGNPSNTGMYRTEIMDLATLGRMAIVKADASFENWKNHFALQFDTKENHQKVHPLIINFIENNRSFFITEPDVSDNDPGMDPRRWTMTSKLLYSYERLGKQSGINLMALLSSIVGEAIAPKLSAFIEDSKIMTFSEMNGKIEAFKKEFGYPSILSLITEKEENQDYLDFTDALRKTWEGSEPVIQYDTLSASMYAFIDGRIPDENLAVLFKIAGEEQIMSVRQSIPGAHAATEIMIEKFRGKSNNPDEAIKEKLIQQIESSIPPEMMNLLHGLRKK